MGCKKKGNWVEGRGVQSRRQNGNLGRAEKKKKKA